MFRKQRRPFGAHLIFALHYVAFIYLLTIVAGVSRKIGLSVDVAAAAGYLLIAPYLVLALKRVYAESTGVILLKAAALLLLTIVLNNRVRHAARVASARRCGRTPPNATRTRRRWDR